MTEEKHILDFPQVFDEVHRQVRAIKSKGREPYALALSSEQEMAILNAKDSMTFVSFHPKSSSLYFLGLEVLHRRATDRPHVEVLSKP